MIRSHLILAFSLTLCSTAFAAERDVEGSKDHPLLARLPGYYIQSYQVKESERVDMSPYFSGAQAVWEGKVTAIDYTAQPGAAHPSMVEIGSQYETTLRRAGAQFLHTEGRVKLAKLVAAGGTAWVSVAAFNEGRNYSITVVQPAASQGEATASAPAPRPVPSAGASSPPSAPAPRGLNERDRTPIHGKTLYERHCADCHGPDGKGNPAKAKVLKIDEARLNLGRDEVAAMSRDERRQIIALGKDKMPSFRKLNADQIEAVLDYTLQLIATIRAK